jgi:hypothetical protein
MQNSTQPNDFFNLTEKEFELMKNCDLTIEVDILGDPEWLQKIEDYQNSEQSLIDTKLALAN